MAIGRMPKKKPQNLPSKLSRAEQDLLSELENGYLLETDSLGGNLVLRRGNGVSRPLSATRSTINALEARGLIHPGKSRRPFTIVWRLQEPH